MHFYCYVTKWLNKRRLAYFQFEIYLVDIYFNVKWNFSVELLKIVEESITAQFRQEEYV